MDGTTTRSVPTARHVRRTLGPRTSVTVRMEIFTAKAAMLVSLGPQDTVVLDVEIGLMQIQLKLSDHIPHLIHLSLKEMKRMTALAFDAKGKHLKWRENCLRQVLGIPNVSVVSSALSPS